MWNLKRSTNELSYKPLTNLNTNCSFQHKSTNTTLFCSFLFNWSIVDVQYCASFRRKAKWFDCVYIGFPGGSWLSGKEPASQCRRFRRLEFDPWVKKILWRRKWQPTHILAGKNPMDREAWQSVGWQKAGHDWATKHSKMVNKAVIKRWRKRYSNIFFLLLQI